MASHICDGMNESVLNTRAEVAITLAGFSRLLQWSFACTERIPGLLPKDSRSASLSGRTKIGRFMLWRITLIPSCLGMH